MNEWVLSVTGMVLLTTVLFAVMPKGKMAVIIKSVVAIMSLTILLKPVILLKDASFDFYSEILSKDLMLDGAYLDYSVNEKKSVLESGLESYLINEKIKCKNVTISLCYDEDNYLSTNYVKIYLQNDESTVNLPHKDIIEKASDYLKAYVKTDVDLFEIYE